MAYEASGISRQIIAAEVDTKRIHGSSIIQGGGGRTLTAPELVLEGHGRSVEAVSFSPDGLRIATASSDATARVWDSATGRPILVINGHSGTVFSVSFSPDGRRVATASHDKTARVWGLDGTPLLTLQVWSPPNRDVHAAS